MIIFFVSQSFFYEKEKKQVTLNISRHYTKAQYFPPSEGSYHINPAAAQYFLKLYQQKKKNILFLF